MRIFSKFVLALAISSFSLLCSAQEKEVSQVEAVLNEIKKIENSLKSSNLSISALGELNSKLTKLGARTVECRAEYEKKVAEKKAALETLGQKQKKESSELNKQRKQQEKELAQAETELATCNAAALRIETALKDADAGLQIQLKKQLLAKSDNILNVIARHRDVPVSWFEQTWAHSKKHAWILNAPQDHLWKLFGAALLGALLGIVIRKYTTPLINRINWSTEPSGCFAASICSSFCHDAPYLLGSLALSTTAYIYTEGIKPQPVIAALAYGLTFLFVARFFIQFSLAPYAPGKIFINIEAEVAKALARRLKVLTVIFLVAYLLVDTLIGSSLPEYALSLVRSAIRIAFAINLIWILWLFRDLKGILNHSWLRYGLSLVLVIAVLADLSGYTNLSGWLMRSVFGSLFVIVVTLILASLTSELLEGLEYGHTPWQRRLRRILGMTPDGHITGFFWFRFVINLGWWSLLILLLIFIWDLSASLVEEIRVIFTQGFLVGSLKIVPARIALALVTLGVLVAVSAWFQGQMRMRWVSKMPMERGAREAMVTMIGYIGVSIAIVITLGVSGIDYSNLAIIAGALSLGIGFGLQNIVNNFVSGLILLFERPVKTGDWVVVGNTEGYVKRISIRATEIQTFDRADVIVPNSELISGQVTNWMLRDTGGRARIPVGVAYGSDTQKVKEILLQVAADHPQVITGNTSLPTRVLFREFGDSSLNFELRCYIKNIDDRINIISDINFSIDAAFRENGIQIPFPQRDLHVKQWPDKGPDNLK
jgi:potassium efflux system protein